MEILLTSVYLYAYCSRCNTLAGENLTADFIAMNPQHCVPTLYDEANGGAIWDSHAVCTYLAAQYPLSDDSGRYKALTPSADQHFQRARFDQRMHYHHGCLFERYYAAISPVFRSGDDAACEFGGTGHVARIKEALAFLEAFLSETDYVVGNTLSVADIVCVTTVSSIVNVLLMGLEEYPKVSAWQKRLSEELPGYAEIESSGVAKMRSTILQRVQQNREKQNK